MPSDDKPHPFRCHCGYVAYFAESTVKEAQEKSHLAKQVLVSGEATEKHLVVFQKGQMLVLCPKQGRPEAPRLQYSSLQGRYLAFIHQYTTLHGMAPAEANMQEYCRVSSPSVHQMVLTLEKKGLIQRTPGQVRSIKVLVPAEDLPTLK